MVRIARISLLAIVTWLALGRAARAQAEDETSSAPAAAPAGGAVVPAGDVAAEATTAPRSYSFGVVSRLRWVTVPSWMLNLFTAKNVPLSSWGAGIGGFYRRGKFSIVGSFNYQNMSPSDGNWLGKDNSPVTDTDLVQFRGLALYAFDVSFIWQQLFTDWIGMHYGAGIGVGIVGGHLLRTSDGTGTAANGANSNCNSMTAGDLSQCHPIGVHCPNGVCSEADLVGLGAGPDNPAMPHRFTEPSVPPAIPVVNVVLGVDFRVPKVRGLEASIEGGFYDAFFLGGAVGYSF